MTTHHKPVAAHGAHAALQPRTATPIASRIEPQAENRRDPQKRWIEAKHTNWQERGLIEHVRKRFGLPVMTFAIDPQGHVLTPPNRSGHLERPKASTTR